MDSGNNSASLQSSSTGGGGGDEEYDSRAPSDSFSSAFHTQNSSMFDPFANYFNPISRPQPPPPPSQNYTTTPNSLFNLDTNWPIKTIRSDQTNNPMLLPSSDNSLSFGTTASISFPSSLEEHRGGSGNVSVTTTTTTDPQPQPVAAADQSITQPARNPKKRSRASRRAPTTVLTTDTTNFRAMVQNFTGIPAPPSTTSSFFPHRTRFDLFASAPNSSIRSVAGNAAAAAAAANNNNNPFNISQPPNYLRRSFPQKIQPPPPFISPSSAASSSSSSSLMLSCLPNINIASVSGSGSSMTASNVSNSTVNYQLSSGVANSVAQNTNLFGAIQQNSILTSLLQSSQKYPIRSKEHEQFQMPSNEEFSMNSNAQHGHLLSGLPNLISQEQAVAPLRNNDNSINAANFHGDKVQETVTTRGGEGMVESWICSSD